MAHGEPHVCAALPRLQINVGVDYCRTHQAWTYSMCAFEVDGDELGQQWHAESVELGPFDGPDELVAAFQRAVAAALAQT